MKFLTLSCAVLFALLFTGPPHGCAGLENAAGHAEHGPGCLFAPAYPAVMEKLPSILPDYGFVGPVPGAPEPGYPRTLAAQHTNRAPPLS